MLWDIATDKFSTVNELLAYISQLELGQVPDELKHLLKEFTLAELLSILREAVSQIQAGNFTGICGLGAHECDSAAKNALVIQ